MKIHNRCVTVTHLYIGTLAYAGAIPVALKVKVRHRVALEN